MLRPALHQIRRILQRAGIDLHRRSIGSSQSMHLAHIVAHLEIDMVLDVGANAGQYGLELRREGYRGRIVSFEPLSAARAQLKRVAQRSQDWQVAPQMALGATDGDADLHVSGNSVSSSILGMLPTHEQAASTSAYIGTERVPVRRLDDVAVEYLRGAQRPLLKIDTQGYEAQVLDGAEAMLNRVVALQVEMSLVPLYQGQMLFDDLRARIESHGFRLFAIFPGFLDPTSGRTLQVDGFFTRPRPDPA